MKEKFLINDGEVLIYTNILKYAIRKEAAKEELNYTQYCKKHDIKMSRIDNARATFGLRMANSSYEIDSELSKDDLIKYNDVFDFGVINESFLQDICEKMQNPSLRLILRYNRNKSILCDPYKLGKLHDFVTKRSHIITNEGLILEEDMHYVYPYSTIPAYASYVVFPTKMLWVYAANSNLPLSDIWNIVAIYPDSIKPACIKTPMKEEPVQKDDDILALSEELIKSFKDFIQEHEHDKDIDSKIKNCFAELILAHKYIKRLDLANAREVLNGRLTPFLDNPTKETLDKLAYELKKAINSAYGLTAAKDKQDKDDAAKKNILVTQLRKIQEGLRLTLDAVECIIGGLTDEH